MAQTIFVMQRNVGKAALSCHFEKPRQRMRTSVSSDEMTMALNGSFVTCLA